MARLNNMIDLPMSEAVRSLTLQIRVTGCKVAAVRMWLGRQVLKLAAFVIGCGIEIEVDPARS
jgi:hypothetical protein